MQEEAIRCVGYSDPSIISAVEPQSYLYEPLITVVDDTSLSADAIWVSEYFLNDRGGLHRGVVARGLRVISGI